MQTIFLVDRSRYDRFITQKLLELWLDRVQVKSYSTRTDIIDLAQMGDLGEAVILLAINATHNTEFNFVNRLSKLSPNAAIYALSSKPVTQAIKKFWADQPVRDFIMKPVDRRDVRKVAMENNVALSKYG